MSGGSEQGDIDFSIDLDDISIAKEDIDSLDMSGELGDVSVTRAPLSKAPELKRRNHSNRVRVPRLYIDLREEAEIQTMRVVSNRPDVEVLCIPSRHIFANVGWIRARAKAFDICLLCRSGSRSSAVKAFYFADDDTIQSIEGGIYREVDDFKLVIGDGSYGMAQYMQLMFAGILGVIFFLMYAKFNATDISVVVLLFISLILYQVFSRTCLLSRFIPMVRLAGY